MSGLAIAMRFPLLWPEGRPRTPAGDRRPAAWRDGGRELTLDRARRRLLSNVDAMTRRGQKYRTADLVLACNVRHTASGARDRNYADREPADVGAAFYFRLDGRPHVLACDRWNTVGGNIGAIAAHVEALRGQERWGVGDLAQAFAGHAALPPPDPWWVILGVSEGADADTIARAYRARARTAHPDAGGDRGEWDRLQTAHQAALEYRS